MGNVVTVPGFIGWLKKPEAEVYFEKIRELRDRYDKNTHDDLATNKGYEASNESAKMEALDEVLNTIPEQIIEDLKGEAKEE
jgi:hypothetical protein